MATILSVRDLHQLVHDVVDNGVLVHLSKSLHPLAERFEGLKQSQRAGTLDKNHKVILWRYVKYQSSTQTNAARGHSDHILIAQTAAKAMLNVCSEVEKQRCQ